MQTKQPKFSVIVPVHPNGDFKPVMRALQTVDYPHELIEVLISYGFSPSKQRNEATKKAQGEILYFLDNDSEIEKQALKRVVTTFWGKGNFPSMPYTRGFSIFPHWLSNLIIKGFFSKRIYQREIGVVGGPNVWRQNESFWASMAGIVLESFFVHTKMAARYRPIGSLRRVGEKELILCNLAVRRNIFQKVGGFNELLYPNEENELLNRIEKIGYQLIYHPGVLVFRPRRETLKGLLGAFFHYGRGRTEQVRVEGLGQNWLFLAPLGLFLYLAGLFFYHPRFTFLPLLLYLGMGFCSALGFATRRKKPYLTVFLPLLFLTVHLSYALGFLCGLVTDFEKRKRKRRQEKIKLVKLKNFGEKWII